MDILNNLQQIRQSLPPATPENVLVREKLLLEARKLLLELERPDNIIERTCYGLVETVAIRTAVKMGLFSALNESSKVDDLARLCKADLTLTSRLLRCLASYGAVHEIDSENYRPSKVSKAFEEAKNQAPLIVCHDFLSRGWISIPQYLEESNWQTPVDRDDTPMARGWDKVGTKFFEILRQTGPLQSFNLWMETYNEGHKDWLEFYPAMERLSEGADQDKSSIMMVDIGGGYGHQALGLKKKFPALPGRFIVQDLAQGLPPPEKRSEDIEYMEHDFNDEQPVHGARLYYLRWITHTWPQAANAHFCVQIRKAMKKGYSRLIINDWIVPDTGAAKLMSAMDFTMLSCGSGMERTFSLHQEYLEKAGLKITNIYNPGDNISESIIEAEVA